MSTTPSMPRYKSREELLAHDRVSKAIEYYKKSRAMYDPKSPHTPDILKEDLDASQEAVAMALLLDIGVEHQELYPGQESPTDFEAAWRLAADIFEDVICVD